MTSPSVMGTINTAHHTTTTTSSTSSSSNTTTKDASVFLLELVIKIFLKKHFAYIKSFGHFDAENSSQRNSSGGLEAMSRLIENEKKPGEGINVVKDDVAMLQNFVSEMAARIDELEEALEAAKENHRMLKDLFFQVRSEH